MRAGEAFDILMGRQRSPARANGPSMTPYLRAANVKDGHLDLSDVQQMDFDDKERSRFALRPGDVVVSEGSGSADAVGASAQWNGEIAGPVCIQNTLLRYRAREGVTIPGFVYQWCRWAYESGAFREAANGTNILHIGATRAAEMEVSVPPLDVQQRIVHLMAHLDNHLANLRAERVGAAQLIRPMIEGLVGGVEDAPFTPMGVVGEFIRGRRFTKADYVSEGLACIHYAQIHTHFGVIAERSLTYVPAEMRSRLRLAQTGDVVIAATSEDLAGLGKATVWLGDEEVAVHDDCYIFRHTLDPVFAAYLFSSSWFQEQKRIYAAGSKVTRISGKDLAAVEVPIPPMADQVHIGLVLRALSANVIAIEHEIDALEGLRSELLAGLITGKLAIPSTYDSLLARVA